MKKILFYITLLLSVFCLSSCEKTDDSDARAHMAVIAETTDIEQIVDNLYVGCQGDVEALARILGCTPSSIERIQKGQYKPTVQFEERIREVYKYYALNGSSFIRLRYVLDPKWHWYNTIMVFPLIHPKPFWIYVGILFGLLLLSVTVWIFVEETSFEFGITVSTFIILLTILFWLVSFALTKVTKPSSMQDIYIDSINPAIEKIL